jgi:transposase
MQDGAGIHRARIASEFFNEIGVTLADWSPYSPNLNPIENLRVIVKTSYL